MDIPFLNKIITTNISCNFYKSFFSTFLIDLYIFKYSIKEIVEKTKIDYFDEFQTDLTNKISPLKETIKDLKLIVNDINSNQKSIDSLNKYLKDLSNTYSLGIDDFIFENISDIEELKNEIVEKKTYLTNIESDITCSKEEILKLQSDLNKLNVDFKNKQSVIENINKTDI